MADAPLPLPKARQRRRPSLGDRLRAAQQLGPKHALGIDGLDAMLRGGLRTENVLVLLGAPGKGKTGIARQVADHLSKTGVAVGWVADDEPGAGVDVRRLQAIGIPRQMAEQPDAAAVALAEATLGAFPFEVFDDPEQTLEGAFRELAALYPDKPRALVIDSIQTCRTERTMDGMSPRERIGDVIRTARKLAREPATRCMVILTSEVVRSAYKARGSDADLSAGKESGAIEYGCDVALMVRRTGLTVTVTSTAKNRLGDESGRCTLQFDPATATYSETNERCPSALSVDDRIIAAVEVKPGLSGSKLQEAVNETSRDTFTRALKRLQAEKKLESRPGRGTTLLWFLAAGQPGQRPNNDSGQHPAP